MELSQALRRSFYTSVARSTGCVCTTRSAPSSFTRRKPRPLSPATTSPAARRYLSTTSPRCVVTTNDPDMKISDSTTHPSSPPAATPREQVQSYIDDVQKIIDGYDLRNTRNMPSRSHESLVHALARAETQINAPNVSPESFHPMLKSLKVMVTAILEPRFPGRNIQQIIADIGKVTLEPLPSQPPRTGVRAAFGKAFGQPASTGATGSTLDSIMNPGTNNQAALKSFLPPRSVESMTERFNRMEATRERPQAPIIRLSSSLGKTVDVSGFTDVTRAFQRMESICSRNKVRQDVRSQKFHIRRGQRKKNLRIIRWRKLFKDGFVAECDRIGRMRRQGW